MLIFQLLNQYEGIAKAAMFGRSAKLNKSFKTNIIEILLLIMCIPRKINFLQLGLYRTRFQIEFCFRDGHQFTGLLDCQSRGEKTLDFAYNASLAAINITKVMVKELCFKG